MVFPSGIWSFSYTVHHKWAASSKKMPSEREDSKGPDQTALPHSLIRAFAVTRRANAQMRLCTCAGCIGICVFCACSKTLFRFTWPIYLHLQRESNTIYSSSMNKIYKKIFLLKTIAMTTRQKYWYVMIALKNISLESGSH